MIGQPAHVKGTIGWRAEAIACCALAVLVAAGCRRSQEAPYQQNDLHTGASRGEGGAARSTAARGLRKEERMRMVAEQIEARGIHDPRVLAAMQSVPRHEFIPRRFRVLAYEDRPLPIGDSQTISQPFVVAAMTELAGVGPGSRVLEVGTGSGYQAAVLAEVKAVVYSIEIMPQLAKRAAATLRGLGYESVHLRIGDGYGGWPEAAPFDAIIVTAAPPEVPEPLKNQLALGGRLVIPVGEGLQQLLVVTRTESGFHTREVFPVRFVPMTGKAQEAR